MISRRLVLGLAVIALICPAEPRVAGVRNFAIVDEHVYRGGQPTAEGLERLAKLGVRTVIDLRGRANAGEKAGVERLGMKYVQIPLPALSAPADQDVERVLAHLDAPQSSGWPVFIHCMRGKDRTGTVVACYRISRKGWTNRKALEEARQLGLSRLERSMSDYILRYRPVKSRAAGAAP